MNEINGIEGSVNQGEESVGQLFPTELDITRYVAEALRGGMPVEKIAEAVFAGFKNVDTLRQAEFANAFQMRSVL